MKTDEFFCGQNDKNWLRLVGKQFQLNFYNNWNEKDNQIKTF